MRIYCNLKIDIIIRETNQDSSVSHPDAKSRSVALTPPETYILEN